MLDVALTINLDIQLAFAFPLNFHRALFKQMANVFSVQIFFILLRETLEASIIISVLLAFLKQGLGNHEQDQKVYKRLVWQVWLGSIAGIGLCLCIGGTFIGVFYSLGQDLWKKSEDLWEGIFCLVASVMITVMGISMLRLNKMKEKWRVKLAKAILESEDNTLVHEDEDEDDKEGGGRGRGEEIPKLVILRKKCNAILRQMNPSLWSKKYALALLPFITTLREGLEAVVFMGGVSLGTPASAFPLAVFTGIGCGSLIGYAIYRGGGMMSIQIFLIASTCFLYLISAGLFSRSVWFFEMYRFSLRAGGDVAENGSGPGSYNINHSVWHVNCCNPETDNGWEIFNAILGWQNSATYGSVISYNLYWMFVIAMFMTLMYFERYGRLPFVSRINSSRFMKKPLSPTEANDLVQRATEATAQTYKLRVSEFDADFFNASA